MLKYINKRFVQFQCQINSLIVFGQISHPTKRGGAQNMRTKHYMREKRIVENFVFGCEWASSFETWRNEVTPIREKYYENFVLGCEWASPFETWRNEVTQMD